MDPEKFVSRFREMLVEKPRYALKHVQAENCGYSDTAIRSKNCYYSFCTFYCEDVFYGRYSRQCRSCSGVTFCVNCEFCIECTDCINGYMLSGCRDCRDCAECDLCIDCLSCRDCFGCIGLHRGRYRLFNEQLSESEYRGWRRAIELNDAHQRLMIAAKIEQLRLELGVPGIHEFRTEECIGDHLSECVNCYQCYDAFKLEDCLYNVECNGNRSGCDLSVCFETELCYSCVQAPLNYNCDFLMHSDGCWDAQFCAYSKNLRNCFGCVYLAEKEYYVLNEPVPPKHYAEIVRGLRAGLAACGLYNLQLYFVSGYEHERWDEESDSAVQCVLGLEA